MIFCFKFFKFIKKKNGKNLVIKIIIRWLLFNDKNIFCNLNDCMFICFYVYQYNILRLFIVKNIWIVNDFIKNCFLNNFNK